MSASREVNELPGAGPMVCFSALSKHGGLSRIAPNPCVCFCPMMLYWPSTSTSNGMNKMIYLVHASRIFDMLGYI